VTFRTSSAPPAALWVPDGAILTGLGVSRGTTAAHLLWGPVERGWLFFLMS